MSGEDSGRQRSEEADRTGRQDQDSQDGSGQSERTGVEQRIGETDGQQRDRGTRDGFGPGPRQQEQQRTDRGRTKQDTLSGSVPLLEGEEILIDARPAWSAYFRLILLAGLILVAGLLQGGTQGLALGLVVAAGIGGYIFYLRRRRRYVLTDRRMMVLTGITSVSTNEAWMVDINNLQTGASLLERLMGHGHISVSDDIHGTGVGFLSSGMKFGGIERHEEVAQVIREQQNGDKL